MLQAGFYEMDVTPAFGVNIPGYFHRRPAAGILDKLYARAAVLDDGFRRTALVTLDCIGLEGKWIAQARARIYAACGIEPRFVNIVSTHTHTGGAVMHWRTHGEPDSSYAEFLSKRAADCVVMAAARMSEASAGCAAGELKGYAFNRVWIMEDGSRRTHAGGKPGSVKPHAGTDDAVTVIPFRRGGALAAVLVNYTLHCDTVNSEDSFSADYPGRLSRRIKDRYGEDVVCLFVQGACGDINHVDPANRELAGKPGRHLDIGDALAGVVVGLIDGAPEMQSSRIDCAAEGLPIRLRDPDEWLIGWAREVKARVEPDPVALKRWDKDQIDLYYAEEALEILRTGPSFRAIDLRVLQIGDAALYMSPGELFVDFGLELKASSPFKVPLVAGYANDYAGYFVTSDSRDYAVYEYRLKQGYLHDGAGTAMNGKLRELASALAARAAKG